ARSGAALDYFPAPSCSAYSFDQAAPPEADGWGGLPENSPQVLASNWGCTMTRPGLAAATMAMAWSSAGVMVERLAGACGQGLLPGARTKVPSSMRFSPGYFAFRFFTTAVSGGTLCSRVLVSELRAMKMTRSGLPAFWAQAEVGPVFHTEALGSAHSSTNPLWTRINSHLPLSTIDSKPLPYHSAVALMPMISVQV